MASTIKLLASAILLAAFAISSCVPVPRIPSPWVTRLTGRRFLEIAWSPDGSTMLGPSLLLPTTQNDLLALTVSNHLIAKVNETPDAFYLPAWSPDGMLASVTTGGYRIWLLDVINADFLSFTEGEGAVWAPDGKSLLVYVSPSADPSLNRRELRSIDLQGRILQVLPLGLDEPPQPDLKEYLTGMSLSPDGTSLLLSLVRYGPNPFEYTAFAIDTTSGHADPFAPSEQVISAKWAPVGDRVAYIRGVCDDCPSGELIITGRGGECFLIPALPPEVGAISWSLDASRLAFLFRGAVHIVDLRHVATEDTIAAACK